MKTSPEVQCHILAKQDTIGLMVANMQSQKWVMMYFPKIEALVDMDNNLLEEILVATAVDSCTSIHPIKAR
eukprot:11544718-Ditylum_brightwellii.AAC.1